MSQVLKENIRMISHQIENFNNEKEIRKKKQIEILDIKSIVTKLKNSSEGLSCHILAGGRKNHQT